MAEPPAELRWNGRGADQCFEPDDSLFYRVLRLDQTGHVRGTDIRFPNTSVNRSKYSRPEHLLWNWPDQGVVGFLVREIPTPIRAGDGRMFDFKAVHDPVRPPEDKVENYAHCEIRPFHGSSPQRTAPDVVKKVFRQELSDRMRPLIPPKVGAGD